MARKIKATELDSRNARGRLTPRGKPYWQSAGERGLHIGYRRLAGKAGTWWARHYDGGQRYTTEALGIADDFSDPFAGGKVEKATAALLAETPADAILNFDQACVKARAGKEKRTLVAAGGTGPMTVRDIIENYLGWYQANRKAFYDARRWADAFILPALGDIEAHALSTAAIRKWHESLAAKPARVRTAKGQPQQHKPVVADADIVRRRRATANRILTVLKAALNKAWRDGLIPSDVEWRRVQAFGKVELARVRHLSIAEAKRLLNGCAPDFRLLVQAALATGARFGELARLKVSDFNRDAGTLAVHISKSGKARHIVLGAEGVELFRELATGRGGDEVLLLRENGSPWDTGYQKFPMNQACDRAKITPRISFHGLRHTWASLAVMAGMPLVVIARNLGHSDTKMVEKHYGHLTESFISKAIREHAPAFGFKPLRKNVRQLGARP
jgi:integrase